MRAIYLCENLTSPLWVYSKKTRDALNDINGLEEKVYNKAMIKNEPEKFHDTEYVFTTSTGNFYYRKSVAQSLKRYYERIGVENRGVHTYRHTFGTNLCKNGVPIQVASSLLGHSDINVTAKYYVSVGMDEKRKAVELLKNGHSSTEWLKNG